MHQNSSLLPPPPSSSPLAAHAHPPLRPQARRQVVLRAHHPLRETADSVRPAADGPQLHRRHPAAIAADAARVAHRLGVLEPLRRREVQPREGARLAEEVPACGLVSNRSLKRGRVTLTGWAWTGALRTHWPWARTMAPRGSTVVARPGDSPNDRRRALGRRRAVRSLRR